MKNLLAAIFSGKFRFEVTVDNIKEDIEFQFPTSLNEEREYILRKQNGKLQFTEKGTVSASVKVESPNGEKWNLVATDAGNVELKLNPILENFMSRVELDGGTYLPNGIASVEIDTVRDNTKLLLTPNATRPGKLYSILPEDGTGDFTVTRNSPAWYWDKDLALRKTENNLARVDWSTGKPTILVEKKDQTNIFSKSEPTSKEGAAGGVTYETFPWDIGFSNCIRFLDNGATRYHYGGIIQPGTKYVLGFFILMDDGSEPIIGDSTTGDFSIIIGGSATAYTTFKKNHIKNNVWFVSNWRTPSGNEALNGIVKYTGQSAKGFRVTGLMLCEGDKIGSYVQTLGAPETRLGEDISSDVPVGVSKIFEVVNGVETIKTTIPGAYTLPEGNIEKIIMT